jgi:hypothetical protein
VYFFPSGGKSLPYYRVMSAPYAESLIETVIERMMTDNSKTRKLAVDFDEGAFKNLGKRSQDDKAFQAVLDKEGVINLRVGSYDEL